MFGTWLLAHTSRHQWFMANHCRALVAMTKTHHPIATNTITEVLFIEIGPVETVKMIESHTNLG